jgi:hypothetical protein
VPGYGPASLRGAYGLTRDALHRGQGETVAVVDAYSDPKVASDLAAYRAHFGLGPCALSSGCLRILNQSGKAGPLPRGNVGWGGDEAPGQRVNNHYFNHPGDAIVFASGDSGYGTMYPADLPFVTSVGGTTVRRRASGGRPWTESAWGSADPEVTGGTGSGCSKFTAKPSWQHAVDIGPGGCPDRTENDVSAVANPATGVAVYDTWKTHGTWAGLGSTSAAAPIITGVYALAGTPAPRSYPAPYLYQHQARWFHDITAGLNGTCPVGSSYLCHSLPGYDAPTGLGTPSGTYAFSSAGTDPVTLLDPAPRPSPPAPRSAC